MILDVPPFYDSAETQESFFTIESIHAALHQFPLGRHLLKNGSLNGYWTEYILMHPVLRTEPGKDRHGNSLSLLELFILEKAPIALATQQRFQIFRKISQQIIDEADEGYSFASIPCGLMEDLLGLDYNNLNNFSITGIDIDPDSIVQAKQKAIDRGLDANTFFIEADVFALEIEDQFDLIFSNGLNIYIEEESKLLDLYKNFHNMLKPKGCLIISFVTPPPALSLESPWDLEKLNQEHQAIQGLIFKDVIKVKWQHFRTVNEMQTHLQAAGFSDIKITYDVARLMPTIVASRD